MTELAMATDYAGEADRLEDLEQTLKSISEAGFTHVHWCNEWDGDYMYSRYEMEQIREWMERYHLKAKALHATKGSKRDVTVMRGHHRRDFTSDWEYNRKAGVELIQNRVDLAACLGVEEIVLHLYVPFETIQKHPEVKESFYRQAEKSLDELQPYCLEKGVKICLENLFDMPGECVLEQWDRMMNRYPGEFLGFCLDTGHANLIWRSGMTEIIRRYGERIFAVHLHDNHGAVDFHMIPGEGNIAWEEVMEAFAASAYQLPLTLELSCGMDDQEEFLKEAYQAGNRLDEMYRKYKKNQK